MEKRNISPKEEEIQEIVGNISKQQKDEAISKQEEEEFFQNFNKKIEKPIKRGSIEEAALLLKNNKIDQIIIAGGEKPDKEALEKEKNPVAKREIPTILLSKPDLDTLTALYILNNFNKKAPEEIYNQNSVTSIIKKGGYELDLAEKDLEEKNRIAPKDKELKIFLDVSGNWLKAEKDGKTTTLYIDHHGAGKREPTSGTKMIYEIMEKAEILKEKPEWLNKFVNFVNDVDNLSYLEKKDDKDRKIFNENYFRNEWPNSLYALAEHQIPFNTLIDLCKSGKIKDPSKPFTQEELDGEIGSIKIGDSTIKELCQKAKEGDKKKGPNNLGGSEKTIEGIKNAIRYAEQEKLNLENTSLGKIIYHNFGLIKPKKGKAFPVRILKASMAFIGTKALGYDTYINWNNEEDKKTFYINSMHPNLSKVVEDLNKADPNCAIDIRGTMVKGKIKNLTEEQFLNIIDPNILKNRKVEDNKSNTTEVKEETWTEKDEEKYNKFLKIIESEKEKKIKAEERLKEIYVELEKLKNSNNVTEEKTEQKNEMGDNATNENKEAKPFSFNAEFIKNKIPEILKSIEKIKEVLELSIVGSKDEFVLNAKIRAKYGMNIEVTLKNAHIINDKNSVSVDKNSYSVKTDTFGTEGMVKKLITSKIPLLSEKIKEIIEKEVGKKVEKIWIENGELKAI